MEFDSCNTIDKIEKVTNIVTESLGFPVTSDYSYGQVANSNRFKLIRVNRYGTLTKASNIICSDDGVSGDSFTFGEMENTSFAAISDGMGIGQKANDESAMAIELLEKMMGINVDREMALKTINSVIRTKSTDERFATLDIAFIDLFKGRLQLIKSGAVPTFIKRKDEIIMINSLSLPIGIFKDVDFNVYEENIQDGDIMVMMSDGVLESNKAIENPENWMKEIIMNMDSQNPQTIADRIIDIAKDYSEDNIKDDMTVVVTKIWKN
jgi:stage II sporulation protein E